ncbi:MAG: FAD:protein FMN transferase [Candidatus Saelkia tenebricola]|nr:FAD:protein FMN transferase [Candidatus Saelkia tenebricola]
MGTSFMIKTLNKDDVLFDDAIEALRKLEGKISDYLPDSEISRINMMAGIDFVPVSQEVLNLIEVSLAISKQSQGVFDPTLRPLLETWGFKENLREFPSEEEISRVLKLIGWNKVIVEDDKIKLLDVGMKLDLGGIAKGYAVDKVIEVLKGAGVDNAIVEVGGDMYCLGSGLDFKGWRIGIRDPRFNSAIIGKITVSDRGIATSGNYENYFMYEGRKFSHIIDPRRGYPVQNVIASVTIVSSECVTSDAWATALSVVGWEEAQRIVESNLELEAVLIKEFKGSIDVWVSSGLKENIEYYEN